MRLIRLGFVPILGLIPLLGFGCSDPVPAKARGAWRISFLDPGPECGISGHNEQIGEVTGASKEQLFTDGEGSRSIECTISGSGSFNVSASASDSTSGGSLTLTVNGLTPEATLESPANGSIQFSSVKTGGAPFVPDSAAPCIFYFLPDSGQGIDGDAGSIWVSFQCPRMLQDTHVCAIQ